MRKWKEAHPEKHAEYQKRHKEYVKKHTKTRRGLYLYAKRVAGYSGREFDLTEDEFYAIRGDGCYYCNEKLPINGIGLDRIDNSKGYIKSNVVPACSRCNQMRNTFFTVEETKVMIDALKLFRASKLR